MNTKMFFVILLVIAGAVIFGLSAKPKQEISAATSSKIETSEQVAAQSSQTKSMGAVEVEVTPKTIESGKDIVFQISLNTHSVELDYDYTKIATLADEQGNTYKTTTWTGGNSGHHLEGELVFAALSQSPKELTLTLEGIDNKSETFIWKL